MGNPTLFNFKVMTKLLITILLVFPLLVNAQWKSLYNQPYGYYDMNMAISPAGNLHVAMSDSGVVHSSYDNGTTWNIYNTEFTDTWLGDAFFDMSFPTDSVGYICGGSGFGNHKASILRTTNGGLTWDSIIANDIGGYQFHETMFVNKDIGFFAGDNQLYKTVDAGNSLYEVISGFEYVTGLFFTPNQTGYLSIREFASPKAEVTIHRSLDLGETWTKIYFDTLKSGITDIYFPSDSIGYAVGGDGLFWKTDNYGDNWFPIDMDSTLYFTSVWFINDTIGYLSHRYGIVKTTDGGYSWNSQSIDKGDSIFINKLLFINDTIGYALGDSGVFKINEPALQPPNGIEDELKSLNDLNVFPNPFKQSFTINIPENIMITLDDIKIYNTLGKIQDVEINLNSSQIVVNGLSLSKGVYILKIKGFDKRVIIK